MVQYVELVARFFAAAVESAWVASSMPGTLAVVGLIGAVGLTTLAVALAARFVVSLVASLQHGVSGLRAAAAADIGTLLGQSDPDADGRPRPRAPSRSLPAA